MVDLGFGRKEIATVEAPADLKGRETLSKFRGRSQPFRAEEMVVQILFGFGDAVKVRHHPGPLHLSEGPNQWGEADQLVAGTGKHPNGAPPRSLADERLFRHPVDLVDEGELLLAASNRLEARKRLFGYNLLDPVNRSFVVLAQRASGQVKGGGPDGRGPTSKTPNGVNDCGPLVRDLTEIDRTQTHIGERDYLWPVQGCDFLCDVSCRERAADSRSDHFSWRIAPEWPTGPPACK